VSIIYQHSNFVQNKICKKIKKNNNNNFEWNYLREMIMNKLAIIIFSPYCWFYSLLYIFDFFHRI
jgi:hypothetical protein